MNLELSKSQKEIDLLKIILEQEKVIEFCRGTIKDLDTITDPLDFYMLFQKVKDDWLHLIEKSMLPF